MRSVRKRAIAPQNEERYLRMTNAHRRQLAKVASAVASAPAPAIARSEETVEPAKPPPLALTIADAAYLLSISPSRLYRLLDEDAGPRAIRIGARRLIRRRDLEAWLDALETGS